MSKGFALRDLYDLISVNANISPKTAERIWKTILDIIISELQYNGKLTIDNFGRFDKIIEGGKDKTFTNELGIIEKRYVPPINSIKFKPSTTFINRLNNNDIDRFNRIEDFEYATAIDNKELEKELSLNIEKVLSQKKKRREKEKIVEAKENREHIDIFKGQPIKCTTINKSFPSINNCANSLNLRPNNIKEILDTKEDIFGYRFITLTTEEYEEEINRDANI